MDENEITARMTGFSNHMVDMGQSGFVAEIPFTWIMLNNDPKQYLPFVDALIQNDYAVKIEPQRDGTLKISIMDERKG